MAMNPPNSDSTMELISCGCKTGCQTDQCQCCKNELLCTEMCRCKDEPDYVANLDLDDSLYCIFY